VPSRWCRTLPQDEVACARGEASAAGSNPSERRCGCHDPIEPILRSAGTLRTNIQPPIWIDTTRLPGGWPRLSPMSYIRPPVAGSPIRFRNKSGTNPEPGTRDSRYAGKEPLHWRTGSDWGMMRGKSREGGKCVRLPEWQHSPALPPTEVPSFPWGPHENHQAISGRSHGNPCKALSQSHVLWEASRGVPLTALARPADQDVNGPSTSWGAGFFRGRPRRSLSVRISAGT